MASLPSSNPPPPPRTLNVQKFAESRAPELESLHSILSARLNHDFRIGRGKRRRTTGHRTTKNRLRKRRKLGTGGDEPDAPEKDRKNPPRRVRRRLELQKNPASGFCTSGDGTRRLRTHLWHAKRFTMVKQWGFYLPLGLQGRGRGSRAVLKWLKNGALVHDASYCHPIQLEGSEDSISAVLRMVLQPSPSSASGASEEVSEAVRYGCHYENAMLYHVGTPLSKFIAPVIIMWRPFLSDDNHINSEQDPVPNGCSISKRSECSTSFRQLWIWIHAAAFAEGFDSLRFACQKEMHERGASVSCSSLEGRIAKLEIMGSGAIQVLQKILHPASESSSMFDHSEACANSQVQKSNSLRSCSTSDVTCTNPQVQKSNFLNHADQLPSHAILSLIVRDPRELPPKTSLTELEIDMQNEDVKESNSIVSGVSTENEDTLLSLWSRPEAHGVFLSDSKNLWEYNDKLYPPVPDNILCTEKHHRRLKFFNLDHTDDGIPTSEAKDSFSRSCSVLLLKHTNQGNSVTRWSIILPLSWVKVFWIPLVSHGVHAIGLRERRWIACNNGLPSFPFDFPDCKAYSLFMAAEASASDRAAELRPPAVRPSRVPIPPPWDCIMSTVEKGPNIIRDHQTLDVRLFGREAAVAISLVNSDPEKSEPTSSSEQTGASFRGSIVRTSDVLTKYLDKFNDMKLLLFPNMSMVEKNFSEVIDSSKPSWITGSGDAMSADRELCFVRVLLHAYKEGAFEEGAVLCAPSLKDLSRWTSRSEDHEGELQIPQTLIRSYFTQQDSGKWELQMPEDDSTQRSYRWPIGFVTTGFVRGSSKPVAEAFCEATLLSLLRGQQWRRTEAARPEIFVLVRNLRSAAYRRALATVVLEQQKDDLEFM